MELKKGMKVRYIGKDVIAYEPGRIYEVLDIDDELGWPEVVASGLDDEPFIVPTELFEVVDKEDKNNIKRFIDAQNINASFKSLYEEALEEIKQGHKEGHWIWFIFPQLRGLGDSVNSRFYGLDVNEVDDYINNETLYSRLIEISEALLNVNNDSIIDIVGYIDSLKIKSCMTLFYLKTNNELFKKILDKYFNGEYCEYTVDKFK